jgi:hypothetical protein
MSDISFLELIPILMALFIWTPQFVNKKLLLRIDNQALVFIINKRTSKSKFVMKLVRPMVLLLMSKNIQVRALHIPVVNNAISDSVSFSAPAFQGLGTYSRSNSIRHSCGVPLDNFGPEIDFLLNHSLAPSTARSYNRAIEMLSFFRKDLGLPLVWPAPLQDITAFVAYMYKLGLLHSTINSYMSGLSFYCKLNDFEDNTNIFIVRKLTDGVKHSRSPQIDNRLPISKELLGRIIFVLPSICSSNYESTLFKAAFSLA